MKLLNKILTYLVATMSVALTLSTAAKADFLSPRSPVTIWYQCCGGAGPYSGSMVSTDGRFNLIYQNDGNFVLYQGTTVLWSSHTAITVPTGGYLPEQVRFQADGNLVVYDTYGGVETAVWASNTSGNPGSTLNLQNDGNLVIYNAAGKAIWSTKTCCH
jgi:hypothetical protein